MSKSAKIAAILVFVAAAFSAYGAFQAKGVIDEQRGKINDLSTQVKQKTRRINSLENQVAELENEVARHQENERNLQVALQQREEQVQSLMEQLAEQKRLAEAAAANQGELAVQVEQLRKAQADLEAKLNEVQQARDRLQYMLEHGGAAPDETFAGYAGALTGEVIGAYPPTYLTIDLDSSASGGATPTLYVQRDGRIVGKIRARKIHYTTLVTEMAEDIDGVRNGDSVRFENLDDGLPFFKDISGTISAVHGMGFFSVDLSRTDGDFHPALKVLRDGVPVADLDVAKVHLVTLVMELDPSSGPVELRKGDTVVVAN